MSTTVKAEATVSLQYHLAADDRFLVRDRHLAGQPTVKAQRLSVFRNGHRLAITAAGPVVTEAGETRRYLRQIEVRPEILPAQLRLRIERDYGIAAGNVPPALRLLPASAT